MPQQFTYISLMFPNLYTSDLMESDKCIHQWKYRNLINFNLVISHASRWDVIQGRAESSFHEFTRLKGAVEVRPRYPKLDIR